MGMKFANNAASTLAAGIAATDTSLTINQTGALTGFPALGAGDYFYCTLQSQTSQSIEIVKVTAIAGGTQFTIVRAQDGTTAQAFGLGDRVELRLCAAVLNDLPKLDEIDTFTQNITMQQALNVNGGLTANGATTLNALLTCALGVLIQAGALTLSSAGMTFNDGTQIGTAKSLSFRNRVRNGRMDISQRAGPFAAIGNGSYSLDGWKRVGSGAQVVTHSQQANGNAGSDFQNVLRVAVTTANAAPAAGDFETVQQPIEGYLVRDLVGNPIAIRFEVKSPKAGTHCVSLVNSGTDRSYILTYNVAAANTAQVVTIPLPGGLITAGTWNWTTGIGVILRFALMAGANYQSAAGAWQVGNFVATAAQVNCMDTIGNTFEVTGVQLEKATISTPFEHRDYSLELANCQRYYEAVSMVVATSVAATAPLSTGYWKVTKRVAPILTLNFDAGAGATIVTLGNNGSLMGVYQSGAHSVQATALVTGTSEL